MPEVIQVVFRAAILFFVLFGVTRLTGKTQIAQLTFYEYVAGITIGSIAAEGTLNLERGTIWEPITAILFWGAMVLLLGQIAARCRPLRVWIEGEPTIVIAKGKIQEQAMKKYGYSLQDLLSQLRNCGAFSLSEVDYAVLEANGRLSVLKKTGSQTPTRKDLGIQAPEVGLPTLVIDQGEVLYQNLKTCKRTLEWLQTELEKQGVKSLKDVYAAQVDAQGTLYVDVRQDTDPPRPGKPRQQAAAQIDQLIADLETFALETEDEEAKRRFLDDAEKARALRERIGPLLK